MNRTEQNRTEQNRTEQNRTAGLYRMGTEPYQKPVTEIIPFETEDVLNGIGESYEDDNAVAGEGDDYEDLFGDGDD